MDCNPDYVANLEEVTQFPTMSSFKIRQDLANMKLDTEQARQEALFLFDNYTRRNGTYIYVQSHACIGSLIINQVMKTHFEMPTDASVLSSIKRS